LLDVAAGYEACVMFCEGGEIYGVIYESGEEIGDAAVGQNRRASARRNDRAMPQLPLSSCGRQSPQQLRPVLPMSTMWQRLDGAGEMATCRWRVDLFSIPTAEV
jgi:hypothetical protein